MAAAFSQQRPGSRASLSGGYSDEQLPGGGCNFRDLSNGASAPTCGCNRFWLNTHFNGHHSSSERVWCFCGHHACFHEAFSKEQSRTSEQLSLNQGTATLARETPGLDGSNTGYGLHGYNGTQQAARQASAPRQMPDSQLRHTGLGIQPASQLHAQSINTRVWDALNAFARDQDDGEMSITTSQLPSTATPSLAGDRATPTRMLKDRVHNSTSMGPPVNIPTIYPPGSVTEEYSATEVATPSIMGTPDFKAFLPQGTQTRSSPSNLRPAQFNLNPPSSNQVRQTIELASAPHPVAAEAKRPEPTAEYGPTLRELQNIVRAQAQRIDVLENLSFSHVHVEDIQDKLELFDGRLLDVEQWRGDHEQAHANSESETEKEHTKGKRRRLLPIEASSFSSDGSFDHNAAMHTEAAVLATLAANAETGPRIDALENRIQDLEDAALPSFVRPWQVQVVLLPWGPGLNGIWFTSAEATQQSLKTSTQASEEWTGAQSLPKTSFSSSTSGAWTTESIQAWADEAQEWLSPKACGPSGTVFQRLASRGFIKEIELTASDSRHISNAIIGAFGRLLRSDDKPNRPESSQYQGLRSDFIPLRKVRKSSRLRFLSPAEMTTPATWNARWFDSSVFMKVNNGQRRLYITTPEAYFQSHGTTWTWPRVKKLLLDDSSEDEELAELNEIAIESCWSYNDRLDQPPTSYSSFASHESQWSIRSQESDQGSSIVDHPATSLRPRAPRYHLRTASMPSANSMNEQVTAIMPKRRVASFETPAPLEHVETLGASKRRRMELSPEAERKGVGLTPRWSREPPSPFTAEMVSDMRSQGASSGRKRGATPFAYATPHSNATFVGRVADAGMDGDTEADTDMGGPRGETFDDEWNGAEDDADSAMHSNDEKSSFDGQDISLPTSSYESRKNGARLSSSSN